MNIEKYKRNLKEITNRVSVEDWAIEYLLKDVDKLVETPNYSSNYKTNLQSKLSGVRYLPSAISNKIDKDKSPLDNLDYIIHNVDYDVFEEWFETSSESKCMEDLVVSVLKNEWRNEAVKYQVIVPSPYATKKPYLYKNKEGIVLLKNAKQNDKNLVTEGENTLLTEEEISYTGLNKFKEEYNPEETNRDWFEKRIKRLFNLTSKTDWVVSQLIHDLKKLEVYETSKTTKIASSSNNELPMEIVKGISTLGSMSEYDKHSSPQNTVRENLSNVVHHAKYELDKSKEWIKSLDNQVNMLTSWLAWDWKVEPNKYQFILPVHDEDGKLTYLYKPDTEFRRLKYKALTKSEAENNPQTVFTKEQLEKEEEFVHMWEFRNKIN